MKNLILIATLVIGMLTHNQYANADLEVTVYNESNQMVAYYTYGGEIFFLPPWHKTSVMPFGAPACPKYVATASMQAIPPTGLFVPPLYGDWKVPAQFPGVQSVWDDNCQTMVVGWWARTWFNGLEVSDPLESARFPPYSWWLPDPIADINWMDVPISLIKVPITAPICEGLPPAEEE